MINTRLGCGGGFHILVQVETKLAIQRTTAGLPDQSVYIFVYPGYMLPEPSTSRTYHATEKQPNI